MQDSYLAQKRKQAGLTQRKLGIELGMTSSYGARRISQVEAGLGKLTPKQIDKAVAVFKKFKVEVSQKQLEANVVDHGLDVLALTERLAKAEKPALMCLCYSGDTRISADPNVIGNIRKALSRNLACAFFVPVPPPLQQGPPSTWHIMGYWNRVWDSAISFSKNFKNLAVYAPLDEKVIQPFAMPPFHSRFFLLLEPSGADYSTALYLMVETETDKQMHLIATKGERYEPVADWEKYFNGVLESWMKTKKLPEGECGYWRRWNEQQLAERSRPATPDSSLTA